MKKLVTGIFDSFALAEQAARDARRFGIDPAAVSLVTSRGTAQGNTGYPGSDEQDTFDMDDPTFAVSSGLMMTMTPFQVPAYGMFGATGPMLGFLSGDIEADGIAGTLERMGVPQVHGLDYETELKRGRVLWVAEAPEADANHVAEMLRHGGADLVDVHDTDRS